MPETPVETMKRRSSLTAQPTDPPAHTNFTRRPSLLVAQQRSSTDHLEVHAKILQKARSMERSDSIDTGDSKSEKSEKKEKEKKKKSKRKEEGREVLENSSSTGEASTVLASTSTGGSTDDKMPPQKSRSSKSRPDPPPEDSGIPPPPSASPSGSKKDKKSKESKNQDEDATAGEVDGKGKKSSGRASSGRAKSRLRGDADLTPEEAKKEKKRDKKKSRMNLNDSSHGLQAALRAESRARGREATPKKKRRDSKVEDPTIKLYSNLDDSESSSSAKKKKKRDKDKSKKRSSSSDRDVQPDSSRSESTRQTVSRSSSFEGYETARVPNRSRSSEELTPGGPDPDPVIGPNLGPPPSDVESSPTKKKKKKKLTSSEGEIPLSPDPDSPSREIVTIKALLAKRKTGRSPGGTPIHEPGESKSPRTKRSVHSADGSKTSGTSTSSLSCHSQSEENHKSEPVLGEPESPRVRSSKSPRKVASRGSPRKAQTDSLSPSVTKDALSPPKGSRRSGPRPTSPRLESRSNSRHSIPGRPSPQPAPAKPPRTPPLKRNPRKEGGSIIYDNEGMEVTPPFGSGDESDVPASESTESRASKKQSETQHDERESRQPFTAASPKILKERARSLEGTVLGRSPQRRPMKNPKLVQRLKECVRLVSQDKVGTAIEDTLRDLAQYLLEKVTDAAAGFDSPSKDGAANGGSHSSLVNSDSAEPSKEVVQEDRQEKATETVSEDQSQGQQGSQKMVFDPYRPAAPPPEPRKSSPTRKQSPMRRQSPTRKQSPVQKQLSATKLHDNESTGKNQSSHSASGTQRPLPDLVPSSSDTGSSGKDMANAAASLPVPASQPPVDAEQQAPGAEGEAPAQQTPVRTHLGEEKPMTSNYPAQTTNRSHQIPSVGSPSMPPQPHAAQRHPGPQVPQQQWTDEQRRQWHAQHQTQPNGHYIQPHTPAPVPQYHQGQQTPQQYPQQPGHSQAQFHTHAHTLPHPVHTAPLRHAYPHDPRMQQSPQAGYTPQPPGGHQSQAVNAPPHGYGAQQGQPRQYPNHQHARQQYPHQHQSHPNPHQPQPPPHQFSQQHPQGHQYPRQPPQQQQQQQNQGPHPPMRPPAAGAPIWQLSGGSTSSSEDDSRLLKQAILREWALQPPSLQGLRPVEHLVVSVHQVFPPKYQMPLHDYFGKWTPLAVKDLWPDGSRLDESALKKALRKVRVFLHPDRLPNDLDDKHKFVCKLLWDVISDAETEFKKKQEELDWIK